MEKTGGMREEMAFKAGCSSEAIVFKTMAEALSALFVSDIKKSTIPSSGSVVLTKLGISLKRMPSIPGIQSICVSK